jgi:hypothetical protein
MEHGKRNNMFVFFGRQGVGIRRFVNQAQRVAVSVLKPVFRVEEILSAALIKGIAFDFCVILAGFELKIGGKIMRIGVAGVYFDLPLVVGMLGGLEKGEAFLLWGKAFSLGFGIKTRDKSTHRHHKKTTDSGAEGAS